jgi:hypothetical protein
VSRARRLASFALASVVAATPLAASAQPPPVTQTARRPRPARVRDALSGEALASFDRASLLFSSRNFGPARAEFERAHDLSGEPRVLYNVAVCDKELGHYARAIASLRASLREGGTTLPAAYVSTANQVIALLAPLVTTLAITADTDGASVFVDGEVVGMTPIASPLAIDVGEHDLTIRKAGYVDFAKHVSAVGGRPIELTVKLEPIVKRGQLVVTATGGAPNAVAMVIVDGNDVGNAPWHGDVISGVHEISVRAPGYSAPARQVDVPPGNETDLAFVLGPDGRLRVTVDEKDAVIRLDGALLGQGAFDGAIPSGEHRLLITHANGSGTPYEAEFAVGRGETRSMSIQIRPHGEVPVWVWVGGGVLVAGAITAGVLVLTAKKEFGSSSPGSLNPTIIPTGFRVVAW